jgi:hypothetical protein
MPSQGASGALERLASQTGQRFPNLAEARRLTGTSLKSHRDLVAALDRDEDVSIVMLGSWGREELTKHSDDDWLVLVNGPQRESVRPSDSATGEVLGVDDRKPGAQMIFGTHAFCDELADNIGLDKDDNRNLTRRVLLMLESIPIAGDSVHATCWERILDGYLAETGRDGHLPRFFLNDVIRYWRTICVDFVGKQRAQDEKWGTRNAKLRTSRKVLFAGGLLPILQCQQLTRPEVRSFLVEQLSQPATDRIAHAFLAWDAADAGARCLAAYDEWIGMLSQKSVREELDAVTRDDTERSAPFQKARRLARHIDSGLLTLLFETDLEPTARQYGIF